MSDFVSPVDAYKAIIDQLVNETRRYSESSDLAKSGSFSKAPERHEFSTFISSLSEQQRELLTRMLQDERDKAIHDLLEALSWWIDCRDVGLTYRDEEMPVDLSCTGLHGDFVKRRDGWEWPTGGRDCD